MTSHEQCRYVNNLLLNILQFVSVSLNTTAQIGAYEMRGYCVSLFLLPKIRSSLSLPGIMDSSLWTLLRCYFPFKAYLNPLSKARNYLLCKLLPLGSFTYPTSYWTVINLSPFLGYLSWIRENKKIRYIYTYTQYSS